MHDWYGMKSLWLSVVMGLSAAASLSAQPSTTTVPADHAERVQRGLKLFDESLQTLLTQRCLECHDAATASGGLDLSTREGLLKGGERGPAILVDRPRDSLLIKLVTRQHEPYMPEEGSPLTQAEVTGLMNWIDCGAPYRRPLGESEPTVVEDWTQRRIADDERNFWSFRPLQRPAVPPVNERLEIQNAIDAFVIAKQVEQGLTLAEKANRRTLLRRLSHDLIGLPPTFEDVQAFEQATQPDAYEQAVDRLLGSPQHGERWARHWLDVARFAESHGFEHDYDRPTAFHYRDFVVQALNDNLPFADFLHWQVAGDEIAPENRLAWMATGFLAAGVHSTQITRNEVERHRYDELDDMVSTLGTAMLGLTVGCARCHDHKYDPIPQADYYRMVSAFTATVRSEIELDFDPVEYQQERKRFDAQHQQYVAAVAAYEREELPQRLTAWLQSPAASALRPVWLSPDRITITSAAGTKFQQQADGSWLATGPVGDQDTYTVTLTTQLPEVAAIRLEALSDLSLQHGGPGRAGNGNFALSNVEILVHESEASRPMPQVRLSAARATFEQVGLPVAAAIDDNPGSAWAVDPQFGRHHAAVLDFAEPLALSTPTTLDVKLRFHCNTQHTIGRLRVSLAAIRDLPADNVAPFEAEVHRLLAKPETEWLPAERQRVLDWYRTHDAGWMTLDAARIEHAALAPRPRTQKVLVATEGRPAIVLHTQAAKEYLDETHFLRRGDPLQKSGVAAPGALQVLFSPTDSSASHSLQPWFITPLENATTTGRRRALAYWMTDTEHGAGALVARVAVNRLWQHHFGQGLVATPSDFGRRGEPPSHPELLEWLACELVERNWDVKHLHRLMVTSRVYQSASQWATSDVTRDRENRWLTRWKPRRLEAEALRDSLLQVTGRLDDRMSGPGSLEPHQRRSLYFMIKRSRLIPMLSVFDAPDGTVGVAERPRTVVAPQALWMLNDVSVRQATQQLTEAIQGHINDPEQQVQQAYQAILQRQPQPDELRLAAQFILESAGDTGLRVLCQTLFCLPEFQWIE